uniref:2-amino-3-carboxymuconate-6-semialdehyde decarboxylase n=1 Tax=Thermogemmatispora argillosa TaxID=2045280 RepID=A0A455T075_9CHLR|nr:amidohydrolase [Thermogemmatispora argillosa]
MIIDFHAHYLAREHLQMHARAPDGRMLGCRWRGQGTDAVLETGGVPLGSACRPEDFYDLDARLELLATAGVDLQVLSPPPFMAFYELPGAEAAPLLREQNEAIATVVRRYPDSFHGLGLAPLQDPARAVEEIAYLMDQLQLAGIEMLTRVNDWNLDAPELEPVWQALDARRALVFIHPLEVLGAERLTRYYLRNLLGNPAETAFALASLLFGGVVERYPQIRFLAAHGGGVAPFVIGRWQHGARVRPELAHLRASPLTLLRRIYVDSLVHDGEALRYLVSVLGAERVVLGSDLPFDMGTRTPVALFGAELAPPERLQILSGHADLLARS